MRLACQGTLPIPAQGKSGEELWRERILFSHPGLRLKRPRTIYKSRKEREKSVRHLPRELCNKPAFFILEHRVHRAFQPAFDRSDPTRAMANLEVGLEPPFHTRF